MRGVARIAAQLRLHRGHVVAEGALALHADVLDACALGADDLGHCVGPVGTGGGRQVGLVQRHLAALPHQDQVARMCHERPAVGGGNEQKMNGQLDVHAVRYGQKGAVLQEGGVQGRERLLLERRIAPQMTLELVRVRVQHGGQTAGTHATREPFDGRRLRREAAVDEHQTGARPVTVAQGFHVGLRPLAGERMELPAGDGGHAGVLPVLVAQRRKAQRAEPIQRPAAQWPQPVGVLARPALLEARVVRQMEVLLAHE